MGKFIRSYISIVIVCCIIYGCGRDGYDPDIQSDPKIEMDLTTPATRAHFEDKDGNASFVWDVGGEMIAVVSHGGSIVEWDGGDFYSPMNIHLIDPANSSKVTRATSSATMNADAAASGDGFFCLSPVNGSAFCKTLQSASEVSVTFSMPDSFSQSASERLEEFEDCCYIHGESTIKSAPTASDKNFTANTTYFRAIPATFRFNVTNDTSDDLILESVKITCDKRFPDKLVWTTDGAVPAIKEPEDKSGYFHTIKTSINSGAGELIKAKDGDNASKGTYYAMCLPFDDAASLSGATLAFILETKDKIHTFNIAASEFFSKLTDDKFCSNKIYTFNFSFHENSVELESVTVSDWVRDPFYLPTEDITARITVNTSYWIQDRENLYTYGFVKMYEDAGKYTMWGECNVGEYLYSSCDITFYWREITPLDASDTNYLAPYFNFITDFKWQTPSRADFEKLFSLPEDNIVMCKDEESGVHGLKFKSAIDSEASFFLPCAGKTDEHTVYPDDGTTVITRTFHGYYWTRDEVDEDNAYLLHFSYNQVETVVSEVSSFGPFTKVLNSGNDLYEFLSYSKSTGLYCVRPILQND